MWEPVLILTAAVALAAMILSLGFSLGTRSSTSALAAAQAVSEMTQVLADEANRQATLSSTLEECSRDIMALAKATDLLASRMDRMSDNQLLLTDSFIQRGFLRAAATPAQVGQRSRPPAAPPQDFVQPAKEDAAP